MENPLSMTELFVGGVTMLVGAGAADVLDRFLATHALTDKNAKDANGNELYADSPPADGSYPGMFNAAAIAAPMDMKRWAGAVGIVALPLVGSGFVKSGAGRSALQLFAFGALVRGAGKAAKDLVAKFASHTATGQRLYDAEMRGAALKAKDGSEASLVSAGLGQTPRIGCGRCANCRTGIGACCGGYVQPPPPAQQPPPAYVPPQQPPQGLPPGFHEPPPNPGGQPGFVPPNPVKPPAPNPAPNPGPFTPINPGTLMGVPRGVGRPSWDYADFDKVQD